MEDAVLVVAAPTIIVKEESATKQNEPVKDSVEAEESTISKNLIEISEILDDLEVTDSPLSQSPYEKSIDQDQDKTDDVLSELSSTSDLDEARLISSQSNPNFSTVQLQDVDTKQLLLSGKNFLQKSKKLFQEEEKKYLSGSESPSHRRSASTSDARVTSPIVGRAKRQSVTLTIPPESGGSRGGSNRSSMELGKSPSGQLISQGREIAKTSKELFTEVKTNENTKQLLDDGKKILGNVKNKEQVQQLLQEGQKIFSEIKKNEKGQEMLEEGKNLLGAIKESENYKSMKETGADIIKSLQSPDAKLDKDQLVELLKQGKSLLKEVEGEKSKADLARYLESAQSILHDIVADKSLTQEGKSLVVELKNNEKSEVSGLLQDSEQLIKELKKNEEVNTLLKEGKTVVMDILTNKGEDGEGKPQINQKEILEKGQQLLKTVTQSEEGKSLVKRGKTVLEKAINQPEVRGMLMSGGKLFDEIKSNEKFRELLQSNVRYVTGFLKPPGDISFRYRRK